MCSSCKQENKGALIHTVNEFNVPISCIAPSKESGIYYIGLENGNIIISNIIDNSQSVINAGNNRIYDIYEVDSTTLLVGVRQEGIKVVINGEPKKRYNIPHPRDTTNTISTKDYAPYAIKADKDKENYYFATSSGIYRLSHGEWENDSNDSLHKYYRPNTPYYHYGVYGLFIIDSALYCATDSGLYVMKIDCPAINRKLTKKVILHFDKDNDTLFATAADTLFAIDLKQHMMLQQATPVKVGPSDMFAYIITSGKRWTLTSTAMKYENANDAESFDLPDKLGNIYKNIICTNDDHVFVACYNKLYGFTSHQNPKGNSHNVIAAASKGTGMDTIFFITMDNSLYCFRMDEVPKKMGKLDYAIEKPIKLRAGNKFLWLITGNSLYRIKHEDAHAPFRIKPVGVKTRLEIGAGAKKDLGSTVDFRSIFEANDTLYVGSRYYLFKIIYQNDTITRIDSVRTKKGSNVDYSDLYITDISESGNYFTSLKHGIFKLDADSLEKIANSDTIGEIQRFISGSFVYTSKGVYEWDRKTNFFTLQNINPKSVLTVYYRKSKDKFEDDGFYIIGYKGITKVDNKYDTLLFVNQHLDLSINLAAIAEVKGNEMLYVGSKTGLYKFDSNEELYPVIIPDEPMPFWQKTGIIWVAITAITIILLGYLAFYKNKLKKISDAVIKNQTLTIQQEASAKDIRQFIISMAEEIKKYTSLLPDSEKEALEKIQETGTDSVPESLAQLETLLNKLHDKFSEYIYMNELPQEMVDHLKKIFDKDEHENYVKKLKEKGKVFVKMFAEDQAKMSYIEDQSKLFFDRYSDYLGMCTLTSKEMVVACCILHCNTHLPRKLEEKLYKIDRDQISTLKIKIHSRVENIEPKNFLLKKLEKLSLPHGKEKAEITDLTNKSQIIEE